MAHGKRTLLPIGIHLSPDFVHMAQLEQTEDSMKVVSKTSCPLSTPADTVARVAAADEGVVAEPGSGANEMAYGQAREFVRQKVATDGFRGKDAVISLPEEHLVIQHVRLPPMQADELKTALPYDLQGKLPFDSEDAVVRHIVAGTVSENSETKQDVLVLATPRHVVEGQVAAMTRVGLNIVGVGVEPCAMCYSYAFVATHSQPTQAGPRCLMIVYLGSRSTHVAILRGQETTFVKGIAQGTDQLVEAVAKAKDMSLEEAADLLAAWCTSSGQATLEEAVDVYNRGRWRLEHLTDEIESCMRYHASLARGAGIDGLYFVGPGARDRALVRVLSAHLSVSCEIGDPFGAVTGTASPEAAEPEMAVAVGLSLFGVQ